MSYADRSRPNVGLPGRDIKLVRPIFNFSSSNSSVTSNRSSQSTTSSKRLPAISLDTDVSRHKHPKPPQQLFPPLNSNSRELGRKESKAALKIEETLSPFDRYIPIGLPGDKSASQSKRKTPIIVVTPTAGSLDSSPEQVRTTSASGNVASSVYSKAFSKLMSPRYKPKMASDASFKCQGVERGRCRHRSYSDSSMPEAAGLEPLTAASTSSRYYRTSTDTSGRSEGWWDLLKSPFLKRSGTLTSHMDPSDKSIPEVPMLPNAAAMPLSPEVGSDTKVFSLDLTPLFEEGKERRVLMYGEAAKYYDLEFDLTTPRPDSNLQPITAGELRELSNRALAQQAATKEDHSSQRGIIVAGTPGSDDTRVSPAPSDDATTQFDESPTTDAGRLQKSCPTKSSEKHLVVTSPKGHNYEVQSPSPTSSVFSPEVGVASVARVRSARTIHSMAAPTAPTTRGPHLEPPPSFMESKRDADSVRSLPSTSAATEDAANVRADAFYFLTGNHPTPRSNAAMLKRRESPPPPPLPPLPEVVTKEKPPQNAVKDLPPPPEKRGGNRWSDQDLMSEKVAAQEKGPSKPSLISRWLSSRKNNNSGQPAGQRRKWVFAGIAIGLVFLILFIILLCLFVVQKHVDMPVDAQWLNLSGFPALPTGVMTVVDTNMTHQQSGCVAPSSLWSCALPDGPFAIDDTTGNISPNFLFEIRFKNGTVKQNNMTMPVPSRTATNSSAMRRRDAFASLIYNTNPQPPPEIQQVFLGNTTDNIQGPSFAGETTPFFITFLPANQSDASVTSISVSVTSAKNNSVSTESSDEVIYRLPLPVTNSNGTASSGSLYPQPASQPLKLYNRGTVDEHYGFYTYFDRTLLVALPSNVTTAMVNEISSSSNHTAPKPKPNAQCTWTDTRFHVQIWTRRSYVAYLSDNATSNGTGTGSAYETKGHGSFPYQTTFSIDRHGGDPHKKAVFCYGLDSSGRVNITQQILLRENRAFGGQIVSPVSGPFAKMPKGVDGIDGGNGGCGCSWDNI